MEAFPAALQHVFGDPWVLLIVVLASFVGVFIGSIPGLTATMAVALLVPITYWLEPIAALAAVVSLVACAIFAGDIPGALLRIPGTPASAAYATDARNLTRQGQARLVLGTALVASVAGGILGALVLMLLGHQLAKVATAFSAVEYFWLYLLGLSCAVVVSSGPTLNGLLALILGLLLSTVGLSAVHSQARFTCGVAELYRGISFVPAMIGLFGVSEVLKSMLDARRSLADAQEQSDDGQQNPRLSVLRAGAETVLRRKRHTLRSAGIGSLIGMLPGAGADIAAWVSFAVSKRFSKRPDLYGRESLEGIADATAANNAALAGAWIPALVLGIPGDSITAIVIGVLLMKNITPGPGIFTQQADLVYSIYLLFVLANLVLLPVGLAAIKAAYRLIYLPKAVLLPPILLFCIVGAYSLNASYLDVTVMLVMGVLGFVLERRRVPLAPVVLALILGPVIEERFIQIVTGSDGSLAGFLSPERPLGLALAGACALVWLSAIAVGVRRRV